MCHVTLLQKLKKIGFANSALTWIASYLSDRAQALINDRGGLSSLAPLNRGVPQGSVLGPLLFALYADISHRFKSCVSHLIYADDLQIYVSFPLHKLHEYSLIMGEHATPVSDWATQNRLRLNVAKTKAIVIGSYFYVNQLPGMETKGVSFGETLVKFEKSLRSLGVVLD